jgi:hypothetical protein
LQSGKPLLWMVDPVLHFWTILTSVCPGSSDVGSYPRQ